MKSRGLKGSQGQNRGVKGSKRESLENRGVKGFSLGMGGNRDKQSEVYVCS